MAKLLDNGSNLLTTVKSTGAITAGHVLTVSKKKADDLTASKGTTVLPVFTKRIEAQEEADRLNVINQSVIGAKEGVVDGITKLVGSNIIDTILLTADCSDHKSMDEYTLFEVMKAAIDGANN